MAAIQHKKRKEAPLDLQGDDAFLLWFQLLLATRPGLGIHLLGPDAKLSLKTFKVFIIDWVFGSNRGY